MDNKELIKAVETGRFTPEQVEQLNTMVKMSMASSLVESVKNLSAQESTLSSTVGKLASKVVESLEAEIENNSLPLEDAVTLLDKLNNISVRIAETKRKIFNGKEMFSSNPLSSKETALLELLKSVDTDSKREKLEHFLSDMSAQEDDFND